MMSIAVALASSVAAAPTPWPTSFAARFYSNISWVGGDFGGAVEGLVQYDWSVKAQRITHAYGAVECTKFYHTSPCVLLTNEQGMYRIITGALPSGQPK